MKEDLLKERVAKQLAVLEEKSEIYCFDEFKDAVDVMIWELNNDSGSADVHCLEVFQQLIKEQVAELWTDTFGGDGTEPCDEDMEDLD